MAEETAGLGVVVSGVELEAAGVGLVLSLAVDCTVGWVGAVAEAEAEAGDLEVVAVVVGFSRLKTLLILLTYFPRLLRLSTSLTSDGPEAAGVDMMGGGGGGGEVELVSTRWVEMEGWVVV